MKRYIQVPEDAEYREYYDSYRLTVDNLNDTDFLYKTGMTNGQVFPRYDEVYGFVNNQAAVRGRNITITSDYIDNFVIRDFTLFTRITNELITLDINCNLSNYRDGKPHYLYVVLSNKGKYEVYDDMFQTDETKILFARFLIDRNGNSVQFYMMLPFAGSADYIKGNQFYQVTDGLRVKLINASTKQLTLTDAKIRFSGINFDDVASPDCLEVSYIDTETGDPITVPIRYIKWDNTDSIARVDWTSNTVNTLKLDKIINYTNGTMSNVPTGKFSIQKLYYDVYEKCIVAMYGNAVYDTREDAVYAVDSVMGYPLPDGITYLIPIAAVIIQNTSDDFTDNNFRIINLDYNEQEVLDSDSFTRQQAADAINKANLALTTANNVSTDLTNHTANRANPHQVKLNQLLKSDGTAGALADDFATYGSVSAILSRASADADDIYYRKTGGAISGNVSVGGTLSVTGTSTFAGIVTLSNGATVTGNITPATTGTVNIGSVAQKLSNIYTNQLSVYGTSSFEGTITSNSIEPSVTNSYSIGTDLLRYSNIYSVNASVSGTLIAATGNITTLNSTTISNSGSISSASIYCTGANNFRIGNYTLVLGNRPSGLATQNAYAIV